MLLWIKVEHRTPDKAKVGRLAELLGIERDADLGTLVRLWVWADQHVTGTGYTGATEAEIDFHARRPGCCSCLRKIGWMKETTRGLKFVRFGKHGGQTAKQRALTNARVSRLRNAASVTETLPDKRR